MISTYQHQQTEMFIVVSFTAAKTWSNQYTLQWVGGRGYSKQETFAQWNDNRTFKP